VPMKQLKHNPAKVQPVTPALQALLSKDAELKVRGGGVRHAVLGCLAADSLLLHAWGASGQWEHMVHHPVLLLLATRLRFTRIVTSALLGAPSWLESFSTAAGNRLVWCGHPCSSLVWCVLVWCRTLRSAPSCPTFAPCFSSQTEPFLTSHRWATATAGRLLAGLAHVAAWSGCMLLFRRVAAQREICSLA
jgi:hypothetical protein